MASGMVPSLALARSVAYSLAVDLSEPVSRIEVDPRAGGPDGERLHGQTTGVRRPIQRVGDGDAPEAEVLAEQADGDGTGPAGGVPGVIGRVGGIGEHDQRDVERLDRSFPSIGAQVPPQRRSRAGDGVNVPVGVADRQADPGKVLHGREHAARGEPGGERVRQPGRAPGVEGEGATLLEHEGGGRARDVRDRREIDVDAEATEGVPGADALRTGDRRVAQATHLRHGDRRSHPGDSPDRATFLVDGDDERRLTARRRPLAAARE